MLVYQRVYIYNYIYILVGGWPTSLKNMSSSVGMMKFPINEKIKFMFQTSNRYMYFSLISPWYYIKILILIQREVLYSMFTFTSKFKCDQCVISRQQIIIGNSAKKKTNLFVFLYIILYIYILIAVMVSIILYAKLVVLCIITVVIIRWLLNSDDDIRVGNKKWLHWQQSGQITK